MPSKTAALLVALLVALLPSATSATMEQQDMAAPPNIRQQCEAVLAPACPDWKKQNATSKLQCLVANEDVVGGACYDNLASTFQQDYGQKDACLKAIATTQCGWSNSTSTTTTKPVDPLQLLYCAHQPQHADKCGPVCPMLLKRATYRRLQCCVPGFPCRRGKHHHGKHHHKEGKRIKYDDKDEEDEDEEEEDKEEKKARKEKEKQDKKDKKEEEKKDKKKHDEEEEDAVMLHGHHHRRRQRRMLHMMMTDNEEEEETDDGNKPPRFAPPPCHVCNHRPHPHPGNRTHPPHPPHPTHPPHSNNNKNNKLEVTMRSSVFAAEAAKDQQSSSTSWMVKADEEEENSRARHHHHHQRQPCRLTEFAQLLALFAVGGFFGRLLTLRQMRQQQEAVAAAAPEAQQPFLKA